ncbi:synaptic vesicle glycoprotein 2B-like [Onthophagus taurus]|uniref:synaptic vesicle glycoprotein 2B-like n=1 Tax=Onthophagus taurus TaxID=166361 RepID=UPI0039BEAD7E
MLAKEIDVKEEKYEDKEKEADFETAIAATGFGKFNFLLILLALPSGWAAMFDSTAMAYVVPSAHCDLNLSLEGRGMLNAISYLGMISSAFIWGFLADAFGRKKLLVIGYGLDAFFVFIAGLSQNFEMLMAAKFMTGFVINGPFAALTSALSEFHSAKYRAKLLISLGVIYNFANLFLPLLAWGILPQNWDVSKDNFNLHSWNFFILICTLPSLISTIGHSFLPESPKFLMTSGKNEVALKVFQQIYSMNTGKSTEKFPIKILIDENYIEGNNNNNNKRTTKEKLCEGFRHIKTLFLPPHLINIVLVCLMFMGGMCGTNTLRLWLPQIFTAINDYQAKYDKTASLCEMLEIITPNQNVSSNVECIVNKSVGGVYTNVLIIGAASIITTIIASIVINKVGKKSLLVVLGTISGISGFCIYFAQNTATTTALSAIFISLLGVCINVQLSVVVDLFPTTLRTFAISLALMIGRMGAMGGNVIFPILLELGCLPPFILIGSCILIAVLITFLIPNTDMKALQ